MGEGNIIVIDNAIEAARRYFDRPVIARGTEFSFIYAPDFSSRIRSIERQNGNLGGVITELSDELSRGTFAEIIFAARGKDSYFPPIIVYTNSYRTELQRFASILGINAVVEKGFQSGQRVYGLLQKMLENPDEFKGQVLMRPNERPIRKENYYPLDKATIDVLHRKGNGFKSHSIPRKYVRY